MSQLELKLFKSLLVVTLSIVGAMYLQYESLEILHDFEKLGIFNPDIKGLEVPIYGLMAVAVGFTINFVRLAIKRETSR